MPKAAVAPIRGVAAPPSIPVGEWDEWAHRIAGRSQDLRLLGGDGYRATSWPNSDPKQPWAVHLHDRKGEARVLVLDVDCKDGNALDARRQADAAASLLELANLKYVVANSGPTGGMHIYVPLRSFWPASALHDIAQAIRDTAASRIDVGPHTNAKSGAIRAPGSPHPSGAGECSIVGSLGRARATFDDPNDDAALRELAHLVGVQLRGELPDSWWQNLTTGARDLTSGHAAKNEQRRSLLRVAHNHGKTEAWVRQQVIKHNSPHGERLLAKRGDSDYLAQEWKRLVNDPTAGRRMQPDELEVWTALVATLAPDLWPKAAQFAEREVLRVLLAHAWRVQRLDLKGLGTRDIGTDAGMSRTHASRVLARLEATGVLARTPDPRKRNAHDIRLLPPRGERGDTSRTAPPPPPSVAKGGRRGVPSFTTPDSPPAAQTPEVFWSRVGGLGRRAHQVLALLATGPDTAQGLARRLGLTDVRSLRRTHLARLEEAQLIARGPNGTYFVVTADQRYLRRLAFDSGALGDAQRRRQRVQEERDAFDADRRRRFVNDLAQRVVNDARTWTSVDDLRQRYGIRSASLMDEVIDECTATGRAARNGGLVRATAKSAPLQIALDPATAIPLEDVALQVETQLDATPRPVAELAARIGQRTAVTREALQHLAYNGRAMQSGRLWSRTPLDLLASPPEEEERANFLCPLDLAT